MPMAQPIMSTDRLQITRGYYQAFSDGNRAFVDGLLSDNFHFSAPPDPNLDRAGYFARCWPGAGKGGKFEILRLFEHDNEVFVTYNADVNGTTGCNTEILTFNGAKVTRVEVYFGWTLQEAA
jgi:hypothetical protein